MSSVMFLRALADLRDACATRLPPHLRTIARIAWKAAGKPALTLGIRATELRTGVRYLGPWEMRHDMTLHRWEPGTTRFLERITRPGMICFDVGAHQGYYTILFAKQVGRSGKVYAFEPHPGNRSLLLRNTCRLSQVCVVPKAIGSLEGTLPLFFHPSSGNHSLYPVSRLLGAQHHVLVDVTTLDTFWHYLGEPRIDVIKIDIEGGELQALKSATGVLAGNPKLILVFEFAPAHLRAAASEPEELLAFLRSLGFSIYAIEDDGDLSLEVPVPRGTYVNLVARRGE